ncbi:hypothetical protein EJB05_21624 [Eragrostis curvula]|uniref:Uncharacterized protein n=1 Tax=Eragrostis curvula TaxID=38414 RepID=A0A5J9V1F0_9POAL|nr:hypothetical protein EJB05_21624 [Eragrostis curvula]
MASEFARALDKGRGRLRETVEAARVEGVGALYLAARNGHLEVCRYLVEELGMDVNAFKRTYNLFGIYGMTPLFQAISYSSVKCVKLLVEAGADINSDCILTALRGSINGDNSMTECLNFLLEAVAKQNVTDDDEHVDERKIAYLKSLGSEAFEKKEYCFASLFYSKAIDLDPDDATLFSNRSLCWLRLGDGEKALQDALKCREMRPDWPKACY